MRTFIFSLLMALILLNGCSSPDEGDSGNSGTNSAPLVVSSSFVVEEDGSISAVLSALDSEADSLTFSIVDAPVHGTVTLTDLHNGTFSYIPTQNYNGSDHFSYKVNDGNSDSATRVIGITVLPVNDAPEAGLSQINMDEDLPYHGTLAASDRENDPLLYTITVAPSHGTLSLHDAQSGSFSYAPDADYHGSDSFSYRVSDLSSSSEHTVSISIRSHNDAPEGTLLEYHAHQDHSGSGQLLGSDVEGDTIHFEIHTPPSHGTVILEDANSGLFSYIPVVGYYGEDHFTYNVIDSSGAQSSKTLTIYIAKTPRLLSIYKDGSGREAYLSDGLSISLLKDISQISKASNPDLLTVSGDKLFFFAKDKLHGVSLWVSDGTPENTLLLKDFQPHSSLLNYGEMIAYDQGVYFSVEDPLHGSELWKSDGTIGGTVLVRDLYPGQIGSLPSHFTLFQNILYFVADDGIHGRELWRSSGLAESTHLVEDIRPGAIGSNPDQLTLCDNGLYLLFSANDGTHGTEPWYSNGVSAQMVADIYSGASGSTPQHLISIGNDFYFTADDGSHGRELWKSDNASASLFVDLNSTVLDELTVMGSNFYFVAHDGNGTELWKSDLTAAGTAMLKDIRSGAGSSDPKYLSVMGSKLYFQANSGNTGKELFISDGTTAGTQIIKDIVNSDDGSDPQQFSLFNNEIYFVATTISQGKQLWKTDGTELNTVMLKEISAPSGGAKPLELTPFKSLLFFTAIDTEHERELWSSAGTQNTTLVFKDLNNKQIDSVIPNLQVGRLATNYLFVAYHPDYGSELWLSDGSQSGTHLIKDIRVGDKNSDIQEMTLMNSKYYFRATDGSALQLWQSDGTASGTKALIDAGTGISYDTPRYLCSNGSHLFFQAHSANEGTELWMTDGTGNSEVHILSDIHSGALSSYPSYLTAMNGVIYFSAYDGSLGTELWQSNGTYAGTQILKDIYTDAGSSYPKFLTRVGNTIYFRATDDGTYGTELWKTDGTTAGTEMVKNIRYAGESSSPSLLTPFKGHLYFTANDGSKEGLWRSDGNESSTYRVSDVTPLQLYPLSDLLYMTVETPQLVSGNRPLYKISEDGSGVSHVEAVRMDLDAVDTHYPYTIDTIHNHDNQTLYFTLIYSDDSGKYKVDALYDGSHFRIIGDKEAY